MNVPKPPLIPTHSNNSTSFSNKLQASTLEVKESLSLFGSDFTSQVAVYPTVNSVILALQRFGLFEPGYLQEGTNLVGTGATGNAEQGVSVSLSSDGNTLAVGGNADDGAKGAVWIFIRTSGVWQQQGSKLVGTGETGNSQQGISVSLSSDGNTLAVGGYDDDGKGATWVFIRTDGVWSQEGSKLVGTGGVGTTIYEGSSISLSSDGNTLAVGGNADDGADNGAKGATWIFTRTDGVWSQQGSKLVGTGAVGNAQQGTSVSLSADGNTLAVGGAQDNNWIGATWIFTRTSGVWSQQGPKLVGTGYIGNYIEQGISVCIRGNTLVVGGCLDNDGNTTYIGATWVFKRTSGVWTQQGSKLVGTGYIGTDILQGKSVSLNDSEDTLITCGPQDNSNVGAVWVFKLVDGVWTQYHDKLVPIGYIGQPTINRCAISLDGSTIAAGISQNNSFEGATSIFVGF